MPFDANRSDLTLGVVGTGAMGRGIAQVAAAGGINVVITDAKPGAAQDARDFISKMLARAAEKGTITSSDADAAVNRIRIVDTVADLRHCHVVVEAIVENLDAKRELVAELDGIVTPDAVLATNTSALSVTEIARASAHPERVVGMHFFNPAPVLPLVEVVRTELAADEPYERAYMFAAALGKEPVRCSDTPGFIVNRILIPPLNDCVRVLDEAGVSPEDLDRAMRFGAGWPIGPCALVDLIGVDIHVHASEALHGALGEPRMAPPERLVRMAEDGHLGRKTGQGFFTYES
jgi:3-hydroxybutyryl-CoA dehydrogenase